MKNQKKLLLILALLAIIFSFCKKDKSIETTDFLLNKSWKRAISDKNISTNPSGRIMYDVVLDCQKDDQYKFNSDGTLIINRGTEKCSVNELTSETLTYSYNKISKELLINGIKYTLAEESDNQIKYFAPLTSAGYDYLVFLLE